MNSIEIKRMAECELGHWWYRGLRDMLARVCRAQSRTRPLSKILDAGCGTGGNLLLLQRLFNPSYLGGFDLSLSAVELSRQRLGTGADIYQSDLRMPEIRQSNLDLILSCDALCIPGLTATRVGLQKLVSALAKGGIFILNLPAFNWMMSEHDRAVGTSERFCISDVRQLMRSLGLIEVIHTYRVFSLFPAILAARLPKLAHRKTQSLAVSDLRPTPQWVSTPLYKLLMLENVLALKGARWPWGSSVFVVGQKT